MHELVRTISDIFTRFHGFEPPLFISVILGFNIPQKTRHFKYMYTLLRHVAVPSLIYDCICTLSTYQQVHYIKK
jgi:hypothetical protein